MKMKTSLVIGKWIFVFLCAWLIAFGVASLIYVDYLFLSEHLGGVYYFLILGDVVGLFTMAITASLRININPSCQAWDVIVLGSALSAVLLCEAYFLISPYFTEAFCIPVPCMAAMTTTIAALMATSLMKSKPD
jgi:hypothetical protein